MTDIIFAVFVILIAYIFAKVIFSLKKGDADNQKYLFEVVKEMQEDHNAQLEKILTKMITPPVKEPIITKVVKNDIEKPGEKEIPFDENTHIPILDKMKIKFEDEEEILPINIS